MTRTIPLLLALTACAAGPAGTPGPAGAPEGPASAPTASPTDAGAQATPDDAPETPVAVIGHATPEQLRGAGACRDLDEGVQPAHVEAVKLDGGRTLTVVTCENFAYQGTFELWKQQAGAWKPVTRDDGQPVRGLGVPSIAGDGTVTWLEKARGPGDCGDFYELEPGPDGYRLTTHTGRGCDAPAGPGVELADPRTWPSRG